MNKNSLKAFAIWGRNELREKVRIKLEILGIDENGITEGDTHNNLVSINGFEYNKGQYDSLVRKYNELGYNELVEEVAYTWFNRLTALAYMEINEYIDDRLIYSTTSKVEPDIIDNYMEAEFFERLPQDRKNMIHDLKDEHKLEEMYSILIEEKCHELSKIMEFMFEKKADYTELLFPSGLLLEDSFLVRLREEIKESIEEIEEEKRVPVELIGWLYQFYNMERREIVYNGSMKKAKITKEYVAPATQLFTPHWIVEYIVENTLGRFALERLGVSNALRKKWNYFIEPKEGLDYSISRDIKDLKLIDPAMGSGHILTYSFDLLYDIYEDLGWTSKEATLSILKNNIYGLEIDDRAGMLASFAIVMKAREKFRRLFKVLSKENGKIVPNTLIIEESNSISDQIKEILNKNNLQSIEKLIINFVDAKEYGSILKLEDINLNELKEEFVKLEEVTNNNQQLNLLLGASDFTIEVDLIEDLIEQYEVMTIKYDLTVENPPYMGNARMGAKLKKYIEVNYKDVKSDLFSVFFIKSCEMTRKDGYLGFMSPFVWMFIKSYENLREHFIDNKTITSLIQLEYSGFADATVPICTFTLQNKMTDKKGEYIKLSDFKGPQNQPLKTLEAIKNSECGWRYQTSQKDFSKTPGSPIAYWVSDRVKEIFEENEKLGDVGDAKVGLQTGDNNIFLRLWSEVNGNNYQLGCKNKDEALESERKWFPYNKGGEKRKWYGNQEYLINWENDGVEIRNFTDAKGKQRSVIRNPQFYFKESISWSDITSSGSSFRTFQNGFIHDVSGMSYFPKTMEEKYRLIGVLNNKLVSDLTKIINPTLHLQIGDFIKLPYFNFNENNFNNIVKNNIEIAQQEWDSRETSWDFTQNQLIEKREERMEDSIEKYEDTWRKNFFEMHSNEEELNRLFIEIYGLQDEMDEKVSLQDITLLKRESRLEEIDNVKCTIDDENLNKAEIEQGKKLVFDRSELVKQFLSYAVGCIMGRYSIDKEGLIIANSDDELAASHGKIHIVGADGEERHIIEKPRFIPDAFGVIPVTNERVFENDIVTRIEEFVSAVYGSENLNENLEFIATHLGIKKGESSRECIRRYFIKDFYKDHLQRYKKRPIYWMVNSGKKEGFSALIYMHRYRDNTIGRVRTDYLNRYQEVLENIFKSNSRRLEGEDLKPKDKKAIEKEIKVINGQIDELKKFALDVKDIADKKIVIDLDDGVKVNYAKFGKILKKI